MKLKDEGHSHKLIIRFMVSYMFVLIMPLFVGIFGYNIAFKIVQKDIEEANLAIINQSKYVMDQKLSLINTAGMQIAANPTIINMINSSEDDSNFSYYKLKNIVDELASYRLNLDRDFIYDYYVYLKKSDYLINSETVYKGDFFYNHILKKTDMSFSEWNDIVLNKYHNSDFFPSTSMEFNISSTLKKYSIVMYSQSLPFQYSKASNGTLIVLIDSEGIKKLFSGVDISKGGWAYIQDDKGNVITTISNDPKSVEYINYNGNEGFIRKNIANKDMIISYTTSEYNGWKYVIALPSDVAMSKLITFKRLIISMLIAAFVIGMFLAYYLAYSNSKPLNNVIMQIREFMGEDAPKYTWNGIKAINGSISDLISSNKVLQEKISEQKPILQNAFIGRLLKGEFNNKSEIDATSSYIGINIDRNQYLVLMVRIYGRNDVENINHQIMEELNSTKFILGQTLTRYLEDRGYYHDIDPQNIAVIICLDDIKEYKNQVNSLIHNLYDEFMKNYNVKLIFGGGGVYSNLLEIWRSHQEALEAIDNIALHKDEVFKWYEDIPKEGEAYFYPIDFEQRIMNYVKSGEAEQIKSLFNILYEENFEKRKLSNDMSKQLFYEIKSTIVKLIQQVPEDSNLTKKVNNLSFDKGIDDNFERLFSIYNSMCTLVTNSKSNKNMCIIKKIIKFMENNYMKQELGLSLAASEFNFSEGYLSTFFKEQTGKNFTDYVESIRMEHACILLEDSSININDIAEMVGYNSVQSFRRAFKRIKGVSPSSLRK